MMILPKGSIYRVKSIRHQSSKGLTQPPPECHEILLTLSVIISLNQSVVVKQINEGVMSLKPEKPEKPDI